jgi:hypothetical protein
VESRLFPDAQVDVTVLMVGHEQDTEQEFSVTTWPGETPASVDRKELIDNHRLVRCRAVESGMRRGFEHI